MKSELESTPYGVYAACKTRDLCLRYLGENPRDWLFVTSTPCPCSREFYNEVMNYSRVLAFERDGGELPYPRHVVVKMMSEKQKTPKKTRLHEFVKGQMTLPGIDAIV